MDSSNITIHMHSNKHVNMDIQKKNVNMTLYILFDVARIRCKKKVQLAHYVSSFFFENSLAWYNFLALSMLLMTVNLAFYLLISHLKRTEFYIMLLFHSYENYHPIFLDAASAYMELLWKQHKSTSCISFKKISAV